jgi:alkylhydroperoxidase/carboxymuconolactone decarboxylase family protein YurZ
MHVRTSLAGGLERCDLEETLLQLAVYAGLPAANTGFQIAIQEMDKT